MKIKYYKTDWENDREQERLCRFEMLSKLIDADVQNYPGMKPSILHLQDRTFHGSIWTTAIVVWASDTQRVETVLKIAPDLTVTLPDDAPKQTVNN